MYYQVLVEINEKIGKSNVNKEIFELDKVDKKEILDEIIIPYLKKQEFQFDGYFLKQTGIVRIVIKTTDNSVRTLSQYENDNMIKGLIMYVSPQDIVSYEKYTTDVTKELFNEARVMLGNKENKEIEIHKTDTKTVIDKTKVFIVHGQDELAKIEVARYIEKFGLEAIILHEQASSGRTIIEKIEKYSNVGFGIILYTPCDVGAKNENEYKLSPRARQNVVFEHGYLMGKIGRNNVCALVKEEIERPNDISGVVYIQMDSHKAWHLALAKEMKSAGYDIDMNLII